MYNRIPWWKQVLQKHSHKYATSWTAVQLFALQTSSVWLTSYEPASYTILLLSSNLVSFQCWENFSDYSWLSGNGGYHLPCLGRVRFPRTISFEDISDYFCAVFVFENWIFLVGGIGRLRPTSVSSRFPQWLIISPIWSPNGWWERWCLSYIVIFWSFLVVKNCWLTWQRPLCEVGFGDMVPTKSFLGYGESLFGKLQVLSGRHLVSKYLWRVSRILLLQMLVCVTYCAMGLALLAMCMSLIQV